MILFCCCRCESKIILTIAAAAKCLDEVNLLGGPFGIIASQAAFLTLGSKGKLVSTLTGFRASNFWN
jgi:hypothetical protein